MQLVPTFSPPSQLLKTGIFLFLLSFVCLCFCSLWVSSVFLFLISFSCVSVPYMFYLCFCSLAVCSITCHVWVLFVTLLNGGPSPEDKFPTSCHLRTRNLFSRRKVSARLTSFWWRSWRCFEKKLCFFITF